jgi:hypothetical protein
MIRFNYKNVSHLVHQSVFTATSEPERLPHSAPPPPPPQTSLQIEYRNRASPTSSGETSISVAYMASTQVSFTPDSSAGSNRFSNDAESGLASQSPDVPRPKRIACVVCRKRKLRCDGIKPSCGTCSRLGHEWYEPSPEGTISWTDTAANHGLSVYSAYDEVRRKSGPKRGYVKALEARLGTNRITFRAVWGLHQC